MYDWPGNFRELKNLVHRAVVISEGDTIELQDLFLGPKQQMVTQTIEQLPKQLNLKEKMELLEADYMSQALKQCKSARSAAQMPWHGQLHFHPKTAGLCAEGPDEVITVPCPQVM